MTQLNVKDPLEDGDTVEVVLVGKGSALQLGDTGEVHLLQKDLKFKGFFIDEQGWCRGINSILFKVEKINQV